MNTDLTLTTDENDKNLSEELTSASTDNESIFDVTRILTQLKIWGERLLDLTKSNPLLGINRSRVSKLLVKNPDTTTLFKMLVVDEVAVKMPLILIKKRKIRQDDTQTEIEGVENIENEPDEIVHPGDVDFDAEPKILHRLLKRIYDNGKTTFEERGVTTLYLTFGTLKWNDPILEESISPLLMVPCQLESYGPDSHMKLKMLDEELQVNPALEFYLRKKHHIELPIMTPRIQREYKNLADLNVSAFGNPKVKVKTFSDEEKREIVFKDVVDEITHHTTILAGDIEPDYRNVIGFFAQAIMRELRLFSCYDILFWKVKEFIQSCMFDIPVDLSDLNVLRNLSEVEYIKLIKDSFKEAINDLTVQDKGDTEIKNYIKISDARPFVVNDKGFLLPKKSVFNKIVGDSDFELTFSEFIENCEDVISFSKNFQNKEASALRIEYKNSEGFIATYYPDFFVKRDDKTVYIVETKGREETDDKLKFERLQKWCEDVNSRQSRVEYKALYIKQEEWEKYKPKNFDEAMKLFSFT